jgi:hypothetical protein
MAKRKDPTTALRTSTGVFTPPYPPSWFDRVTAWVDRLPGPSWAFYVLLAIVLALAVSAIQWREGAYPAGTFYAAHVFTGASLAAVLGLMHFQDKIATSAITSFRPLLSSRDEAGPPSAEEGSTFANLSYRLATLPPRPALLATIAGSAFASIAYVVDVVSGRAPPYLAGAAGTAFSTAAIMIPFILANGLFVLLVYHTIHQLLHVSRIYTNHTRIDIYQLQSLYALSLPGALTALGLIAFVYGLYAITPPGAPENPVQIGIYLVFAGAAAAAFTLPLIGAHRALVAEKNASLAHVSSRFKATTIQLHDELDNGRLSQMDALNKALASLQIEQDVLRKIPTWPWDPAAVRALVAALLLPVAVWIIQYLLARLLGI